MTEPHVHRTRADLARLAIATIGPMVAAVGLSRADGRPAVAIWVPIALLVLSAALVHRRAVGSQILARSVWWANLVLGILLSIAGSPSAARSLGAILVVACGAPLLAMGSSGLDEGGRSAFRPVAFRTTLMLAMTMAVADAQALLFWGVAQLEDNERVPGLVLVGAALVSSVSIVGLYRLRVWGLLSGALSATAVIVLMLSGVCRLDGPLSPCFITTSAVQLLLPCPIFVAIARGRAPAAVTPSRAGRLALGLVVGAMMVGALAAVASGRRLLSY
jgi:hypothetical protein